MKKNFYYKKINFLDVISSKKKYFKKISESLALIEKVDYFEYEKLKKRLAMIFVTYRPGYSNGFHLPEKIWFTNYSMITKLNSAQLASGLIHEGVHATQPKKLIGYEAEKPAIDAQKKFLKKLNEDTRYLDLYLAKSQWNDIFQDSISAKHFENLLIALKKNKLMIKNE